jgi:protein-S-isoprenylcysteine O-methyltransferase Ste14
MKASPFLFRFRMVILVLTIAIGFWAPWVQLAGAGTRISLLEWLALEISRLGLLRFTLATPAVIVCGSLIALLGAILRIWASAWLGHGIVIGREMQAGAVMADGPFRYVRNPLYLGLVCMIAAMALIMPASGALFVLISLPVLLFSLIRQEEEFLSARCGEPYRAYLRSVPRLIPRLRTRLVPTGNRPHWLEALLSEINPIGVFLTITCLSWTYDNRLMIRAILVTLGVSLVVRALMLTHTPAEPSQKVSANEP